MYRYEIKKKLNKLYKMKIIVFYLLNNINSVRDVYFLKMRWFLFFIF